VRLGAGRVIAIVVVLWAAVLALGITYEIGHAGTYLEFTNPLVGRITAWSYFLVFPWLVIVFSVWYEWPLLSSAARVGRLVAVHLPGTCGSASVDTALALQR